MSSLTRYSSYERLMLGKQKLIECSSMQAFKKFKIDNEEKKKDDEENDESLKLSQCFSDGNENHLDVSGSSSRTRLVNFGTKPDKKLGKTDWKDINSIKRYGQKTT